MPNPGEPTAHRLPVEDSYLELLTDTLETLDLSARGQFLQRFLRTITHLDLRESQCLQLWEQTLARRAQLTEKLGRPVSLKTALIDVLSAANLLRVPILIEYDELKRLQINAATDPLTGLYNRRLFEEFLQRESNRARRYNHQLALVLLDLHRFKEVNDKFGHPRGDEVLRAAAATLRNSLRTSDSAFRIGGDEFALLLPQTDSAQAMSLSRRIGAVFEEAIKPLNLGITVGMDHGVAIYPEDGETVEVLIRVADERLYRRKHVNHGKAAGVAPRPAEPPPPPRQPISPAAVPAPEPERKVVSEPPSPREMQPVPTPTPTPIPVAAGPVAPPTPPLRPHAELRKAERVSMAGTNAYALLGESGGRRARVIDIGFGGVGLELGPQDEISGPLLAVLHVPILPPVRVTLQPVWSKRSPAGMLRVGCCFVS